MSPQRLLLLLPAIWTFLLVGLSHAATFLIPITKDPTRLQYYATFNLGTPPVPLSLSLDLSNPTNWLVGPLAGYTQSSSYLSVPVNSSHCISYVGPTAPYTLQCNRPPSPICNDLQCNGWATTPLHGFSSYGLDALVEDLLSPIYRTSSPPLKTSLPLFPFIDINITNPLNGLSQHSKGILSLARNQMSLPSQISSHFNSPRKFALCLPSSVFFGGGPYPRVLSASFASTPLVVNTRHTVRGPAEVADPAAEYYIGIVSIQVDGAPVKFNSSLLSIDGRGDGGTRLSTMAYYTSLHPEIYKAFVSVFVEKAKALNIGVVGPVSSFKACFNSTTIKYDARSGSGVPVIELVMAGNARWRIYGSNSMVKVSKEVQCLGVFDAGPYPEVTLESSGVTAAVVIGGRQMEDSLVEFDLEASKLRVSSSLQRLGTSCSKLKGV